MTADGLPKHARVTVWNALDEIGRLVTDDGEEIKVGRAACSDFIPSVGAECWLHELRADRPGQLRRATSVSSTTTPPPSLESRAAEARAKADAAKAEPLVPVFVVPLLELLSLKERELGRPLIESEVLAIRSHAPCTMLRQSEAQSLASKRGSPDLDPENAWQQWQICRAQRQSES